MAKADIIITEKKSISTMIARALAPESFDNRGSCRVEHRDLLRLRTDPEKNHFLSSSDLAQRCVALLDDPKDDQRRVYKDSGNHYFCTTDCTRCAFFAQHLDALGMKHARATKKRLDYLKRSRQGQEWAVEDISYYVIPRNEDFIVIFDTEGTPYTYRDGKVTLSETEQYASLEDLVLRSPSWENAQRALFKLQQARSSPARKREDQDDSEAVVISASSHLARQRLFNHVLARRLLPTPEGKPIEIERILAATDYDISGSYIFSCVITNANLLMQQWADMKKTEDDPLLIHPDMLFRMTLQSSSPESIREEFERPLPFDFENAYAGMARDVIDITYGRVVAKQLRSQVKHATPPEKKRAPLDVSFGRVHFLSLEQVIDHMASLRSEQAEERVYLVFPGSPSDQELQELLAKKAYAAVHTVEKKVRLTPSHLLSLLREKHIGTHTTRYRELRRLVDLHLLDLEQGAVIPTAYGQRYYQAMKPLVDTPLFSISRWNEELHAFMQRLRETETGEDLHALTSLDRQYHQFMQKYFASLQPHLRDLQRRYPSVAQTLVSVYPSSTRTAKTALLQDSQPREKVEGILLRGHSSDEDVEETLRRDGVLSRDQIAALIDPATNKAKTSSKPLSLVRVFPQPSMDLGGLVRRVCGIDKDRDFTIVESDQLERLFAFDQSHYTVFRASTPYEEEERPYALSEILQTPHQIAALIPLDLPDLSSPTEKKQAHESLRLQNLRPADVAGKRGMMLVREYHLPWQYTNEKLAKKERGLVNVASFSLNDVPFQRADRYAFGKVHNFESLLATMYEKYGFPFKETADMAEQLYLGVS